MNKIRTHGFGKASLRRLAAMLLFVCLVCSAALGEGRDRSNADWVNFLLLCNEGMNNDKGNAGNTMMVVAMHPTTGRIRLMMFCWDTFIDYEGYDLPQTLDMPYRNNGPAETMKVFDENFGMHIHLFMSINFLNLASLIDYYGGVTVDVTRAERNALNGMVSSKKEQLKAQAATGLLSQILLDSLATEYYISDFGPETHLNGLQAVGFGWLQYDSVYNCCERSVEVIASLFSSVAKHINEQVILYTDETGYPDDTYGKRPVNLDQVTEEDMDFLHEAIGPIFQKSFHDLKEDEIDSITLTLARVAYQASRQGFDLFSALDHTVLPLEANDEYVIIAGAKGHVIDKQANIKAIREFLYKD